VALPNKATLVIQDCGGGQGGEKESFIRIIMKRAAKLETRPTSFFVRVMLSRNRTGELYVAIPLLSLPLQFRPREWHRGVSAKLPRGQGSSLRMRGDELKLCNQQRALQHLQTSAIMDTAKRYLREATFTEEHLQVSLVIMRFCHNTFLQHRGPSTRFVPDHHFNA
jgi:hypothetical protein